MIAYERGERGFANERHLREIEIILFVLRTYAHEYR